jgi:hypothetical protein
METAMPTHDRRSRRATLLAALGLAATATAARAHHGWAEYRTEDFSLTGRVDSASLGNPHGLIRVRDEQSRVWDVVLGPPAAQRRAGLMPEAVPVGTQVEARGHRHRDPNRLEMKTERLIVGSRTFDIYPNRS